MEIKFQVKAKASFLYVRLIIADLYLDQGS